MFIPQWGRKSREEERSAKGVTEKRNLRSQGNLLMNREGAFYESLLEGCYHEMGHVLATLHYFPDEEKINRISFAKQQNGGFQFDTNFHEVSWSLPSQLEAFVMISIGGGIFQQMKMKYGDFKKFSESNQCPVDVLREFFSKQIKCPIDGMEADMDYLNRLYSRLLQYRTDLEPLNLEKEKEKAIDLFIPYWEDKKIDELCEHIVDKIMANDGACDTIVGIKEIKAYLGV